jgi:hypothetical protein
MHSCPRFRWVTYAFFQRVAAAFLAISVRFFFDKLAARAFPPLSPPSRPSATAAGFFPSSVLVSGGAFPVAMSVINLASWFASRGLLERFGILHRCHGSRARSSGFAGRPISN